MGNEGEELKEKMDCREDFLLLDVRDTPDYKKEKQRGAAHMHLQQRLRMSRAYPTERL